MEWLSIVEYYGTIIMSGLIMVSSRGDVTGMIGLWFGELPSNGLISSNGITWCARNMQRFGRWVSYWTSQKKRWIIMIFVESPSLRNNCDEIIMNYDELWWIILNLRQLQADGNRSAQCETFDVPSLRNDGPGWELKPRCRMLIDLSTHQCAKRMLQSMKMRPLYPNEPGKKNRGFCFWLLFLN